MRRSGLRAAMAAVVLLSTLVGLAAPATAAGAPLMGTTTGTVWRGMATTVLGRNFPSGQSFEITADHGQFGATQTPSATVNANASGGFAVAYLPSDVPLSVDAVHLTATEVGDPTVVITATIPVSPPTLTIQNGCAGGGAGVDGVGFPDGAYTLAAGRGSIAPATVTATRGRFLASVVLPDSPGQYAVRAADAQTGQTVATTLIGDHFLPAVIRRLGVSTPWRVNADGWCFAPNEGVTVDLPPGVTGPATLTAGSFAGDLIFTLDLHPGLQPHDSGPIRITGQTSGQTAYLDPLTVPGTTLFAGQSLSDSVPPYFLASSTPGYTFNRASGGLVVMSWNPDGSSRSVWSRGGGSVPESGTTLQMQVDGNLVLRSATGSAMWSSGTTGIGRGNRVTMHDNGNVVMTTADGRVVWSTKTDRILGKGGYLTLIEWTAWRDDRDHLVHVNGIVRQWNRYGQLNRGSGRPVYVKAYGHSHGKAVWRTVAVRRTGATGHFSIALRHPPAFFTIDVPRGGETAAARVSPFRR